jgi:hypothetical protein
VTMSLNSTREYLNQMRERYQRATSKAERSHIVDAVVEVKHYNRKYAIRVLNQPSLPKSLPIRRPRSIKYREALPVIQAVWEALDYPCAERLHPVLLSTADLLHKHGEVRLTPQIRSQLADISRSTLARRLATFPSPVAKYHPSKLSPSSRIKSEIPIDRHMWNEDKPGALEVDLVEHNGSSSTGLYAYTIDLVDVVTLYSRRRAVLGRGQTGIHREIDLMISEWPHAPWALHFDNGSEFLNRQLKRYCETHQLKPSRGRPYHKNDQAHVEQRNRQFVRNMVGFARYDTQEQVAWLNEVYALLDLYTNLFIPSRKVIAKERIRSRTRKQYDEAKTPVQRLLDLGILDDLVTQKLRRLREQLNPALLHRQLETLISAGPTMTATTKIQGVI